jgi:hypothetical protein
MNSMNEGLMAPNEPVPARGGGDDDDDDRAVSIFSRGADGKVDWKRIAYTGCKGHPILSVFCLKPEDYKYFGRGDRLYGAILSVFLAAVCLKLASSGLYQNEVLTNGWTDNWFTHTAFVKFIHFWFDGVFGRTKYMHLGRKQNTQKRQLITNERKGVLMIVTIALYALLYTGYFEPGNPLFKACPESIPDPADSDLPYTEPSCRSETFTKCMIYHQNRTGHGTAGCRTQWDPRVRNPNTFARYDNNQYWPRDRDYILNPQKAWGCPEPLCIDDDACLQDKKGWESETCENNAQDSQGRANPDYCGPDGSTHVMECCPNSCGTCTRAHPYMYTSSNETCVDREDPPCPGGSNPCSRSPRTHTFSCSEIRKDRPDVCTVAYLEPGKLPSYPAEVQAFCPVMCGTCALPSCVSKADCEVCASEECVGTGLDSKCGMTGSDVPEFDPDNFDGFPSWSWLLVNYGVFEVLETCLAVMILGEKYMNLFWDGKNAILDKLCNDEAWTGACFFKGCDSDYINNPKNPEKDPEKFGSKYDINNSICGDDSDDSE